MWYNESVVNRDLTLGLEMNNIMLIAKNISCIPKLHKELKRIYKTSFPQVEQYPILVLRLLALKSNVNALAFFDEEKLVGFSYFFINNETVFILYLAINDKIRSKGYGTQIINYIKEKFHGRDIFLDVEAPDENADNTEQRKKRIAFYAKNGIHETNNFFKYDTVKYEILSTNLSFSEKDYNMNLRQFFKVFKNKKAQNKKQL